MDITELMKEESNFLDERITQEEIQKSTEQLKSGKAPGPDGYTTKFYNVFKNELVQWLQIIMNNILENGSLPRRR